MVEALFPREHTMSASILSMMLACVGFLYLLYGSLLPHVTSRCFNRFQSPSPIGMRF